jgi:hypothetical protein
MKCGVCEDTGWVCETHENRPGACSASPRACRCGAPGMPCLVCNEPESNERPRMPAGFAPRDDADKGPIH